MTDEVEVTNDDPTPEAEPTHPTHRKLGENIDPDDMPERLDPSVDDDEA